MRHDYATRDFSNLNVVYKLKAKRLPMHQQHLNITVFDQHCKLPIKSGWGREKKENQHVQGRFSLPAEGTTDLSSRSYSSELSYFPNDPEI